MTYLGSLNSGGGSLWPWCPGCLREQQYVRVNASAIGCIVCGRHTIG